MDYYGYLLQAFTRSVSARYFPYRGFVVFSLVESGDIKSCCKSLQKYLVSGSLEIKLIRNLTVSHLL